MFAPMPQTRLSPAKSPSFVLEETPPLTREWCRIPVAVQLFGIPRSRLFELIRDRSIRSASLTHPGKRRGLRLLHIPSILSYIEANAIGGKPQITNKLD
jgi:hypothetical protein